MVGNLALLWRPIAHLAGRTYRLFDVGGAVGIVGIAAMLISAVIRHTVQLYRAEQLP